MEFQDLDLSKKLPFIRSSNMKIIILISAVVLLIGIGVFSNLYGKMINEKTEDKNNNAVPTIVTSNIKSNPTPVTAVDLVSEAPVIQLSNFFVLILQNKRSDAEKFISEYSSPANFQSFIEGVSNNRDVIKFYFVGIEYSQQQNFAYVTVKILVSGNVSHYRFAMIKTNSEWKIFSEEVI